MKKHLAAAGLALGTIVGGVALGATVFAPGIVGAQEATESTEPACARPGGGRGLDAAAEAIGIDVDDLRTALRDGQTIAEVAAANGVDAQTVIDAMLADLGEKLAEQVAAGDLTQEEADERLAGAEAKITAHVNGEAPARPEGGRPPRGERPAPEADEA
jgi:hypothetical protein